MEDKYICRYCGRECKNANSLRNHERLCKENPNRQILVSNFIEWNRKRKDLHIKGENQYTKARRLGLEVPHISEETRKKISSFNKGKHLSDEVRKKISETQKKNYKNKSRWYTQTQHRLSYAEQYFIPIFSDAVMHYHVNRFFLDFAWPDKKYYVEVDGEQHRNGPKVVEHDMIRTNILNNEGWMLIERIYWPDFVKLNLEERNKYINEIKYKLGDPLIG